MSLKIPLLLFVSIFFYTRVILVILHATEEKLAEKDLIEMSAKT